MKFLIAVELAKTRLQLDGELQGRATTPGAPVPTRVYTSAADALRKTWKYEGIRGVQRGLGAAVSRLYLYSSYAMSCVRVQGQSEDSVDFVTKN